MTFLQCTMCFRFNQGFLPAVQFSLTAELEFLTTKLFHLFWYDFFFQNQVDVNEVNSINVVI